MKLKITDVREVIGELISETWSPQDVQRYWKNPTAEERARIQRELGMPLHWDAIMIGLQDHFVEKWRTTKYGQVQPMIYYAVGVSVKNVNSTLDEGYGICIIAIAYDSPFGKPSEYWVAGYGPRPDMDQLEQVFLNQMSHMGHGSSKEFVSNDRLNDWLKQDFFHAYTSEMIYKCVVKEAQRAKMHIQLDTSKKGQFHIRFDNIDNMTYALRKAEPNIRTWIHKDYPDRMVRIKADPTHFGADISILIYNKWTNQMIGIVDYVNVDISAPREK